MKLFEQANKIVIKVGSSFLIDPKTGTVQQSWLDKFVDDIADLAKSGKKVVVVVSGAVAIGCKKLGINLLKAKLQEKQIASVLGQHKMLDLYRASFSRHDIEVAQLLLTTEDIENRKRFLSIKTIIAYLLDKNIIPIVNENDLIANTEIRFGDNDRLSARVAQIVGADLLLMLSLVDGLFSVDPKIYPTAQFVSEVYDISSDVEKMADDSIAKTGGMSAKVAAAKIALNSNCNAIFTNGTFDNPIKRVMDGARCTKFLVDKDATQKYRIG
jgi:glutamate 5-kinase